MKHGWIEKREGDRGTTFRVRYWVSDPEGRPAARSRSFTERAHGSKREAEREAKLFLARTITEISDGVFVLPADMTLAQLVQQWISSKEPSVRESTIRSYRAAAAHILPDVGAVPIQHLKPMHIQQLYRKLRDAGRGEPTMRLVHVVISSSLRQAVRWEIITRNPAASIAAPRPGSRSLRYWTPAQCVQFLDHEGADERHGVLWRLLIATGMRIGEALALTWEDIDFQRSTVRIRRTLTQDLKNRFVLGETTKSPNGQRTIPLTGSTLESLRHHRTAQRARELAAVMWTKQIGDFVFTRDDGQHLWPDAVRDAFARAVKRSGLPTLTPHGLRHSFATSLMLSGVHVRVAADLLGDTPEVVLRVYSHVTVDAGQSAIEAVEAAMLVAANTTTSDPSEEVNSRATPK